MACNTAKLRAGNSIDIDMSYAGMHPGMVSNAYAGTPVNMANYNASASTGSSMHYTMAPLKYMSRGRIAGGALPEGAIFRAASSAQRMGIPISSGTMTCRPNPYLQASSWSQEALPSSAAITTVRASMNPEGFAFDPSVRAEAVKANNNSQCVPTQSLFSPPGAMQCVPSPASYGEYKLFGVDPDYARSTPYMYAQSKRPTVCAPDAFTIRGL